MTIFNRSLWGRLSSFILPIILLTACVPNKTDYKSQVVLRVNEATLTAEQFSDLLVDRLKGFDHVSAKDTNVIAQAKNSIVQDFIVRIVTEEYAKTKQLFVRKEQLESEVQKIKSNYPDEIAFRKSLAENKLKYDEWLDRMKYTLLEKLVHLEIMKTSKPPSVEDAKAYYNKNKNIFQQSAAMKIRQIVVENDISAQKIKRSLNQGDKFQDLAKQYSQSEESAYGGDVGWVEKGASSVFDNALKLGAGQVSPIIKSPQGYHILQVVEKRPARTLSFEEVKKKIERELSAQQEQNLYSQWLEQEVLHARVFKDDDLMKHIQVYNRSQL